MNMTLASILRVNFQIRHWQNQGNHKGHEGTRSWISRESPRKNANHSLQFVFIREIRG